MAVADAIGPANPRLVVDDELDSSDRCAFVGALMHLALDDPLVDGALRAITEMNAILIFAGVVIWED